MFHPTKAAAWVKSKLSPRTKMQEADPAELQKLLWSEVEISLKQYLKALIEALLKTELEAHLRALRYERSEERKDYRNGSYERTLATKFGEVEDLRVPRTRNGSYAPKLFDQLPARSIRRRDPLRRSPPLSDRTARLSPAVPRAPCAQLRPAPSADRRKPGSRLRGALLPFWPTRREAAAAARLLSMEFCQ